MHPLIYQGTSSESWLQAHTQGVYPISWNKRADRINLGLKKKKHNSLPMVPRLISSASTEKSFTMFFCHCQSPDPKLEV